MTRARARGGFTLLELLVVVAVIAVLASLLLPALNRGRGKARAAQCVGNLRQWGLAYRQYADDNKDFLPRRGQGVQPLAQIERPEDWFNALPAYLGSAPYQQIYAATRKLEPPSRSLLHTSRAKSLSLLLRATTGVISSGPPNMAFNQRRAIWLMLPCPASPKQRLSKKK